MKISVRKIDMARLGIFLDCSRDEYDAFRRVVKQTARRPLVCFNNSRSENIL